MFLSFIFLPSVISVIGNAMMGNKTLSEIREELRAKGIDLKQIHELSKPSIRRPLTAEELDEACARFQELMKEFSKATACDKSR